MKICRYQMDQGPARVGWVVQDQWIVDLSAMGVTSLESLLEETDLSSKLERLVNVQTAGIALAEARLLPPVEHQEVWAAGVTYLRSKTARMAESEFSATAYDRVYEAARPELFFKSLPEKVVGPGEAVGIRRDAQWSVPEPELALFLNSRGQVVGCTIGNDMSSRDIEGDNLLYLPQAKIYERSCALGPWVVLDAAEPEIRSWSLTLRIERDNAIVFAGETSVDRLKRSFGELAEYLFRSQQFPHGAVLLTGTGIVPPDDFTLRAGDRVRINLSGLGELENPVVEV